MHGVGRNCCYTLMQGCWVPVFLIIISESVPKGYIEDIGLTRDLVNTNFKSKRSNLLLQMFKYTLLAHLGKKRAILFNEFTAWYSLQGMNI